MNHKSGSKTLIIEHLINRLFTLQLTQPLKLANVGYLIHQALYQAPILHKCIQGSKIRISGEVFCNIYILFSLLY